MDDLTLDVHPVWVTEYFWPGLAEDLVRAPAQRLARSLAGWRQS